VVVNGTVIGDVHASGHVELASEARIHGNVYYALIEMAMGAEVNGNLVHQADTSVVQLNRDEATSTDT
jgi:cytoskeletal protein CcmA (bactofilin family)